MQERNASDTVEQIVLIIPMAQAMGRVVTCGLLFLHAAGHGEEGCNEENFARMYEDHHRPAVTRGAERKLPK